MYRPYHEGGILSLHDGRYMLFLIYVELYLGFYDFDWSGIWGDSREDGGSDQCRSGFRRRRSIIVYYDDRCDGFVGGTYGDRTEVRPDRETDPRDTAFYQISVSADSRGTSGQGVYRDESDRKCAGAGVGLHASGVKGDGGAGEAGGGEGDAGVFGGRRQKRWKNARYFGVHGTGGTKEGADCQ